MIKFIIDWSSFVFFAIAAFVHIGFFIFESFILQKPNAHKILKISEVEHNAIKVWAFNQGFYNLFLAIGVFIGLYHVLQKQVMIAGLMTGFSAACMLVAGIVLWFSVPRMRKYAYIQAGFPILGFIFLVFHILSFVA